MSSNIAARGGLLGQGSVDGVVGSGTIGSVGVTTLLPAAVARTKKRQLRREDDEDDLCEKDQQLARPRREETPVDHP
jgi:hypothetical protein